MSHWNHRIIRREIITERKNDPVDIIYGIHEVYYHKKKIDCWTDKPMRLSAESLKDLKEVLGWMQKATEKPVLVEIKRWGKPKLIEYKEK